MPVIAMTHEMGSLAKDVAARLTETLGLSVMRHEVLDHIAQKMHVPASLISRLREGSAGLVERLTTDERSVAVYTAEELFALAEKGNVVLRGWGATCWLRPVEHVVCVRVTRSLEGRVDWVMNHLDTDDADMARAEIQRSDHAHASRMHQQFGVTWGDPTLYDITLNTDRLSVDSCVAQISQLVTRPEFAETEQSRARLRNMTLQARIRAALKAEASTAGIDVTIEANNGQVALSGIVVNAQERANAESITSAVAGVKRVDNRLRLMAMSKRFISAKY